MYTPTVFVSGATGCQGGAVARYLRSKAVPVHALVRNPTSTKAKELESIGVNLTPGDFDNKEALEEAMKGCTSLFLVLMPDFEDLTAERRWATNIFLAADAAGVKHAIYSSGFSADNPDRLVFLERGGMVDIVMRSKNAIEKQTRNAGFDYWTILRPGFFMANFVEPFVRMYPDLVEEGVWTTTLTPTTVIPLTDTITIGKFGGEGFLNPERFHGKEITYADEWLEAEAVLRRLSKAVGKDLRAKYLSDEEIEKQKPTNPFISGQLCMRDMAKLATKKATEEWGIPLGTFDEFLQREKEAVRETYYKLLN
ncbi:nad dependent epimerase [Fusarium longipes]|uniref:Nad dependent epimerase n=1 Tax=Fusarium longipes TaxID=694270 RepID=A0A395SDM6_9HYPO|nr:nad dependent epimerase [Fusarium longipes]